MVGMEDSSVSHGGTNLRVGVQHNYLLCPGSATLDTTHIDAGPTIL